MSEKLITRWRMSSTGLEPHQDGEWVRYADMGGREAVADEKACSKKKCGEFNMLRCCREAGHSGDCNFVVDHANDYPHNRKEGARTQRRQQAGE